MAKGESLQAVAVQYFAEGEPGGAGRPLVGLFDLAEREAERQRVPFGVSVARVAEALSLAENVPLFIGRADRFASQMAPGHVWFPGRSSSPAGVVIGRSSGARQGWGAASARHTLRYETAAHAVPALIGRVGALMLFRQGAMNRSRAADCRGNPVAGLCILEADAARLFKGQSAELKLIRPAGLEPRARPVVGPGEYSGSPAYEWEKVPGLRARLNHQFDELVKFYKADARAKRNAVSAARIDLADTWGVSVYTIKQQTTGEPRTKYESQLATSLRGQKLS